MATPDSSIFANWTAFADLFTAPNTGTDGMFGIGIWAAIWFVFFIVYAISVNHRLDSMEIAMTASSLSMVPITGAMAALQWINPTLTVFPIILGVAGVIVLTKRDT